MKRMQWVLLTIPTAVVAVVTAMAVSATDDVDTNGELPGQVPATVETPLGELLDVGLPDELTHLVGRRVQLVVDISTRINDIAFWTGTPPNDLLVVIARSSKAPFAAPSAGEYITVSGVIRPVPEPEAMFSWNLTRRDAALLEERGVYVHVDRVVSGAPHLGGSRTAEEVDEWGRETAPPPGEQVETPLGLPPPKP